MKVRNNHCEKRRLMFWFFENEELTMLVPVVKKAKNSVRG